METVTGRSCWGTTADAFDVAGGMGQPWALPDRRVVRSAWP
jgi:hypothetical protein